MVTKKKTATKSGIADKIKPIGDIENNVAMLVYGRSGTGKTHFSSTWPKPILYLDINEHGLDTIDASTEGIDVLEVETWADFDEAFWYLNDNETEYKTIVIDQFTNLQDLAMEEVRRKNNKRSNELFTMKNWGELSGMLKEGIQNFKGLIHQYNLCFLAHERVFGGEGDDDDDDQINPVVGARVMPSVGSFLDGAMDAIGNTFIKEEWIEATKKGEDDKRVVRYCMRTGPHGFYTTKIRRPAGAGPLPEFIVDPSYQKIRDLNKGKTAVKKSRKLVKRKT